MDNTISIDFGTTRTKLAHFSPLTRKPELMRFQKDDPFIPSLFYLFRDNDQILFGHDAEEMLEEDPAGIIAVLKRHLKDTYVRANRKRKSPGEMLLFLFTKLRELAGKEIPAFEGNPPRKVILTIPVLYGPPEERLLRDAASHAGFEEVELLPEPVAAARAWLAETGERSKEVIVFDCGGGTIDWAYLRRENGDFRVIPDCPPGGDRCVGGHDIDNELLDLLKDKLPEELHGEIEEKAPYYLQQVRTVKERYCRGRSVRPLRIGSTQVALHEDQMRSVFENRFISQSCEHLKIYIERVRKISSGEIPMVLLVGAVQGLRGLSEAIESRCSCKTSWWERSEYTTVLGALSQSMEETRRKDKREEWKKVEEERRKAAQEEQHRVEEEAIQKAREEAKEFTNSLGMKFVLIPAGTFMMGSLPDEIGRRDDEKSHVVIVSSHSPCRPPRSLRDSGKRSWGIIRHVLRTAGTTVLWRMCSGMTHRGSSGSLTGWRERTSIVFLPRQSGGTPAGPGAFPDIYFGDDRAELREYAWYSSTSDGKTHPVRQKKPNAWGLYDMIGNVWEWCQDWYTNYPRSVIVTDPKGPGYIANRVLRGGAWSNDEWAMRSAVRDRLGHGFCSASIGFRFARDA